MTEWLVLAPEPESPRAARSFVIDWLRTWDYGCLVDPVALVTSELTSNTVRHARETFTVGVEDLGHGIRVSVQDPVRTPPVPRTATESDVSGRGMAIVDALSDAWGTEQIPAGKVVWCTFAATERHPAFVTS